ncbi:MAG: hypothetical protein HYV42_05500 [Candidatus Magasanikbacteria bacterium]|nr:hypothetical protein [Candidatus Magasanikbacteria bacterium]
MGYAGHSYVCPHCGKETEMEIRNLISVCPACGKERTDHVMDEYGFCSGQDCIKEYLSGAKENGQHPFVRDSSAHMATPPRPQWTPATNLLVRHECRREDSRIVLIGDKFVAEADVPRSTTTGADMY